MAEAHGVDEWQTQTNEQEGICIYQHTTFAGRREAAQLCVERLGLTMPTLIDDIDNVACKRFAAWPERIYIVGADGRIAFKGEPGPFESNPAEASEALRQMLSFL